MNQLQDSYAKADNSLSHLLVQIDKLYQDLPDAVKQAFDNLGSTASWGCHCDLDEGQKPDGCVLDEGRQQDCVYAGVGNKMKCQYWQPVQFMI
jgi:hypothetical protein